MSIQTWQETLVSAQVAGTLYNTYTTAKTVLPVGCLYTLPPNWWTLGKTLRMIVHAGISNRVTGPDTTTFQLMMGSTAVVTSGAINLTTTAHTTIPAVLECIATCYVVGTSAALRGQWMVRGQMFAMASGLADNAAGTGWAMGPNTAPANGTAFDSTAAQTIDFFAAQSVSNAGNGIQVHQYFVESLN